MLNSNTYCNQDLANNDEHSYRISVKNNTFYQDLIQNNTYYHDPIKNNIYYYIDNLVRNCKNKTKQYEIWQLKIKLIYCKTLNEFEHVLIRQRSYYIPSNVNCVPSSDTISKINTINDILDKIQNEKQICCKHIFSKMTCLTSGEDVVKRIDDDVINECSKCACTTKQLDIQLPSGTDSPEFPTEESFVKFCEICRVQKWDIK
jgi:hypothetical protein